MLVAQALLRAFGWHLVGHPPAIPRCVVVFAPHTSNWDLPLMFLVRMAFGKDVAYLAKHTLFRFPFGWFFRATGAIPVERSEHHHLVQAMVRAFQTRPKLWLALAPEGTRAKTGHWKSGFYHVAQQARVPLLLAFLDARTRRCGVGPLLELTHDPKHDIERLRAFYSDKRGIRPERESDIRIDL